jgi:hypothetical protein
VGERISIPPRCRRGAIPQSLILSHCVPPVSIPPRSQRGVRLIDLNNNVRINTEFQFHPVFHGGECLQSEAFGESHRTKYFNLTPF